MSSKTLLSLTAFIMMIALSSCRSVPTGEFSEEGEPLYELKVAESLEPYVDSINPIIFLYPLGYGFAWVALSPIPLHITFPVVTTVLTSTIALPTFTGISMLDLLTIGTFEKYYVIQAKKEGTYEEGGSNLSVWDSMTEKVAEDLLPIVFWPRVSE